MLGISTRRALPTAQHWICRLQPVTYKKGAVFGDKLIIRSTVKQESPYRLNFVPEAYREGKLVSAHTFNLHVSNTMMGLFACRNVCEP